jgi:hypothetical protein
MEVESTQVENMLTNNISESNHRCETTREKKLIASRSNWPNVGI